MSEKVAATHRLFTRVGARPVPGDSGHVDDRSEEGNSGDPRSGSGGGGDRGGAGTGSCPGRRAHRPRGIRRVGRHRDRALQATAEEFTARGARVLPVITDVSDAAAVNTLASRTLEHFGRVDIVVNNAAITNDGGRPLWQTDPQDWQRVLGVNVLGVVHGIQAFVPYMVIAGAGHMVNIASLAGLTAMPFAGAYCASKHAVVVISETLRGELDAIGLPIGVTVACPALVRTPMTEDLFTLTQADDDVLAQHLPAHLSRPAAGAAQAYDLRPHGAGGCSRAHPRRGRSRSALRPDTRRLRRRRPSPGRGDPRGTG